MKSLVLELVLLPALVLTCQNGYDMMYDGRCILLSKEDIYYNNVRNRCAEGGGHLPMIKTKEDSDKLQAALYKKDPNFSSFWIGLTCDGQKLVWDDGTEAKYTNFASPFTCNGNNINIVFYVHNDMKWITTYQSDFMHWLVCDQQKFSNAPCGDFEIFKSGKSEDVCFELHKSSVTWNKASDNCKNIDASLPVIHDQAMNDAMQQAAYSKGLFDGAHIGLQESSSGTYAWVDGSDVDFKQFLPGFPNDIFGKCVAMQTETPSGRWVNEECDIVSLPYVCIKPAFVFTPQTAGCPDKIEYAPGDEIFSPGFPEAPGVATCDYYLMDPSADGIAEIEITFFESNLCCDELTIYDGIVGSTVLKKFSGSYPNPIRVKAKSNAMRLVWKSTSGNNVIGFHGKMIVN